MSTKQLVVLVLSEEDDTMTDAILRLLGKKGITLAISKELANKIAIARIEGEDEVGDFPLRNGYNIDGEESVVKIMIEE